MAPSVCTYYSIP